MLLKKEADEDNIQYRNVRDGLLYGPDIMIERNITELSEQEIEEGDVSRDIMSISYRYNRGTRGKYIEYSITWSEIYKMGYTFTRKVANPRRNDTTDLIGLIKDFMLTNNIFIYFN